MRSHKFRMAYRNIGALAVGLLVALFAVPSHAERTNLLGGQDWTLLKFGQCAATLIQGDDGIKVAVTAADGTDWHVQVGELGTPLEEGQTYVLRFRAKADAPRPVELLAALTQPDFHDVGLRRTITLGTDWQTYTFPFTAQQTIPSHLAVPQFYLGTQTGTVWISQATLIAKVLPSLKARTPVLLRPRPGEVSLSGSIRAMLSPRNGFVMWVTRAQSPGGTPQTIEPPRQKSVRLQPGLTRGANNVKVGDLVTVVGKDFGAALTARTIRVGTQNP